MRGGNPAVLESELVQAIILCREGEGGECLDLLAAVVEDMRQTEAARTAQAELLQHLARYFKSSSSEASSSRTA